MLSPLSRARRRRRSCLSFLSLCLRRSFVAGYRVHAWRRPPLIRSFGSDRGRRGFNSFFSDQRRRGDSVPFVDLAEFENIDRQGVKTVSRVPPWSCRVFLESGMIFGRILGVD
ncbi:hypothetical protein L484_009193 [Morus notabilis]|uniref:Uncharacterized protein n=1 Tax=Morus notabilis TaxID=981085 RepID=W9SUM0_9ROSA|nr:hypothetical protein L484_009193 [Morus notabilis]